MSLRTMFASVLIELSVVLAVPLSVLGQEAAPAQPAANAPPAAAEQGYVLGPGDVVEIAVLGRTDFTTRGRIGPDGAIDLPFLGAVAAADKTARGLGDEVARRLESGGFFAHPILKVEVVSYASRYVTVLGAVQNPGLVPVDRSYRVSEILARVGGIKPEGANYVVLRPLNGPEQRLSIEGLATGDDSQDPYVSPGDKIYSPPADVFYVSGQVKTPGAYPVTPGMTVRMAISRGGGLTEDGTDRGVKVMRHGINVGAMGLNGPIEAGDVIVVGERLF